MECDRALLAPVDVAGVAARGRGQRLVVGRAVRRGRGCVPGLTVAVELRGARALHQHGHQAFQGFGVDVVLGDEVRLKQVTARRGLLAEGTQEDGLDAVVASIVPVVVTMVVVGRGRLEI